MGRILEVERLGEATMKHRYAMLSVLLIVAGCAASPAVISDISDSSIKVQSGMGTQAEDVAGGKGSRKGSVSAFSTWHGGARRGH